MNAVSKRGGKCAQLVFWVTDPGQVNDRTTLMTLLQLLQKAAEGLPDYFFGIEEYSFRLLTMSPAIGYAFVLENCYFLSIENRRGFWGIGHGRHSANYWEHIGWHQLKGDHNTNELCRLYNLCNRTAQPPELY